MLLLIIASMYKGTKKKRKEDVKGESNGPISND